MKSYYTYPCIFSYEDDGINVSFPDLPGCLTYGFTENEAFMNAKEALEGYLYFMEVENDELPTPTDFSDIDVIDKQVVTIINVWMDPVREEMRNKTIKKTLTIPKWINDYGNAYNINFSLLLTTSVKKYVGLVDDKSYTHNITNELIVKEESYIYKPSGASGSLQVYDLLDHNNPRLIFKEGGFDLSFINNFPKGFLQDGGITWYVSENSNSMIIQFWDIDSLKKYKDKLSAYTYQGTDWNNLYQLMKQHYDEI